MLAYIREQSGGHFDPDLVDLFFRLYDKVKEVMVQDWEIVSRGAGPSL